LALMKSSQVSYLKYARLILQRAKNHKINTFYE
jgi:hypothetical protein